MPGPPHRRRHTTVANPELIHPAAAWLQAQLRSGTLIFIIDGSAGITAADVTQLVRRGFQTSVPVTLSDDQGLVAAAAPQDGGSPLTSISSEAPCKIAAGRDGANLRSRPDPEAPIIAVMAHRDSALPASRGIGADSLPWWKLSKGVWVRVDATDFGGNCKDVQLIRPGN